MTGIEKNSIKRFSIIWLNLREANLSCSLSGVLIDETERQCCCQLTNQRRLKEPLDTPMSYGSAEDDETWQHFGRIQPNSNYTSPEIKNVDPSKVFDFDPNAIQVMDDVEFDHLPEAVNREILKNSQEIIFEDEEAISQGAPIKLHKERSKTQRGSPEIILEEEESNVLMQKSVERNVIGSKNTSKIYMEEKLPLMKVKESHEDVRNILPGGRCSTKSRRDYKMYLERKLRMQDRRCRIVPVNRDQMEPKIDFFSNEKEKSARAKLNGKNDIFVINDERFFKEFGRNASNQPTVSFNQESPRTNLLQNEKSLIKFGRYAIDESFTKDDGRPFGESNADKVYEMCLEEKLESEPFLNEKQDSSDDRKVLEQSDRDAINNMKYIKMDGKKSLRESLMLNAKLNYDFPEQENGHLHEKIRIESENRRPAASRLAKIIIQRKLYPADFRSPLVPSFSDLSPESGFCEGNFSSNLSPECGRKELLIPRNRFEDEIKGGSSSSENNLSQKNMLDDLSEECVQAPTVEVSKHVCDNIQIVDESRISTHGNFFRKRFVDENDISVKCVQSRITEISSCISGSIENVDDNRASLSSDLSCKHFFDNSLVKCVEVPLHCTDNNEHRVSSSGDSSFKHFDDPEKRADARLSENDRCFVEYDNVMKCTNTSDAEEKIMRVDKGMRDIDETMRKHSFPNASRKFNDFGDAEELNCRLMSARTNNELRENT